MGRCKRMKIRLLITKDREISFISHLEYVKTIERAIKRAKIPVAYSEGFNPHMKISLASALGVGVSSNCEACEIELKQLEAPEVLVSRLKDCLPRGIKIVAVDMVPKKTAKLMATARAADYLVTLPLVKELSITELNAIEQAYGDTLDIKFQKKLPKNKGVKTIDLKDFVGAISLQQENQNLLIKFSCLITPTGSLKAMEISQVLVEHFALPVSLEDIHILRERLYTFDEMGVAKSLIGN